jgi:histone acetyltransferase (RNA polymerase elongator complex component)
VDKSVREAMDEKELDIINEYLQKFLETILIKKAILPMNVLDIINEKNNEIPLDILRKFIDKSLEDEIEPLKQKVANFDGCNSQLKVVNNKIKEIQTQASSFKLSKCEQCFMGITFPAICFRCGHCYHSMCLNANDDNDLDDVDCPKCEEEKEKVKQEMLEMKSIYDDINSKEKLKSVNNKIKEIQTQASSVKLSKCEICYMGITFPAICFRCGHCYHSMCLNANDDNDLDDVDCPKCEEEKETTKQKMLELKSIYEDVNSKEKLKNTLDYNTDKFEFIHSLYGRGIINIGPAYDDYGTNEIKEALSLIEDNTKDNTKDKTKENNK